MKTKPGIVATPLGVVKAIEPDAPAARMACIDVEEITVKEAAATPPKFTNVVPVKFVPVMVMTMPGPPTVGLKDVIVGGGWVKNT